MRISSPRYRLSPGLRVSMSAPLRVVEEKCGSNFPYFGKNRKAAGRIPFTPQVNCGCSAVATPSAVSAERFADKDSGSFALFDCVEHLAIEMF